jgi:hypothetical protein
MKRFFIFIFLLITASAAQEKMATVRILTDGFNCREGIIVADQIREMVTVDSLLKSYAPDDSNYIVVEITSFKDGSTVVINAAFSTVTPIQKNKLDYQFTRRLVSSTLGQMHEISYNIIEKIHLIRKV